MDVKIDPASTTDSQGFNGYLQLALRGNGDWHWYPQFGDNVGTNYQTDDNGWRHFEQTITLPGGTDTPTNIHRVDFQLYGGPVQNVDGPVTLWIDNLYYTTFTVTTSPPPTMTLVRTVPGCNITATVNGGTYSRQDIRTADANSHYSWINPTNGAVTYSFTITNFPSAPTPGLEARMLLVGNHFAPGQFADYNETNVIYLRLYDVGGHFDEELYYKVNADHSSIFAGNFLGRLSGASPIGTWGITLAGTNVTMFGPPGTLSTNLGPEVLTAFNTYTYPYIGIIPNNDANVGQSATFSTVTVSGATTALNERFRNLNQWKKNGIAEDATGVLLQPSNTWAKILWPFPHSPIYSVHATNVLASAPSWPPAPNLIPNSVGATIFTVGTNKAVLLPTPTNTARFYRLESP
ncbi:MAG: hypothetical protein DME25_15965 [Verrucomicrobia bacterium]|nr:MAG: hypothetical protein DME25_15965 [Verrucomicrobiota bacterium]